MYRIVTPTCTFHALTHCLDLRSRCSWSVPMRRSWSTEGSPNTQMAVRVIIHFHTPMMKTSLGEDLSNNKRTASPAACGNYLWSQGVEKSNKTFLASTLPRHSSQQTPPHMSAHNRRGDHGTKHFTRLAWKEEERAVREIVLQQMLLERSKTGYWVLQIYLYPVYKPKPRFKLVTLGDCTALVPPAQHWICIGIGHCFYTALRLWLPLVYTGRQLLMLPALLAPSAPPSMPLWSCPAWLAPLGPPTPSGPVLPGSLAPLWSSPCPVTSLQGVPWSSSNN